MNRSASLRKLFSNKPIILFGILIVALMLRALALFLLSRTPYIHYMLWDERAYHTIAEKIVKGTYHSTSVYEFSPLPIYLMAMIYKIFSVNIFYIRIFHCILGVLTCLNIYLITRNLGGKTVGYIACLAAAFYQPFIFFSTVPLKTSLFLYLFSLLIFLFLRSMDRPSWKNLIFLGFIAGLCINVRPNCLVLLPFLPVFVLWNSYRGENLIEKGARLAAVYCIGFLIAVSPFVMRNLMVAGVPALATTQTGQNLYYGNNPESPEPYYRPLPFAESSPFLQGIQFTIEASRRSGIKMSHKEASGYWRNEVIRLATERPGLFLVKIFRKILALFNRFESGDHYHVGFLSKFVGLFKLPFLDFGILLPFGMAGMAIWAMRSKKGISLVALCFTYSSTLILFFVSTRLRMPLVVILIPFAVLGGFQVRKLIRERNKKGIGIYVSTIILFVGISFLPLKGTDDLTAFYNTHAIVLNASGRKTEAVEYWERSSQMEKPFSAYANLSLAQWYFSKRDIQKIFEYLKKVPDNSFAAAQKYHILGDLLIQLKDRKRAIRAYRKSLEINSGQRVIRAKLIKILHNSNPEQAQKELADLEYINSFYDLM